MAHQRVVEVTLTKGNWRGEHEKLLLTELDHYGSIEIITVKCFSVSSEYGIARHPLSSRSEMNCISQAQ